MVSFTPLAPLRYPLGKAKNDGYRGTDRYPVGADSISALFVCALFREHMECSPTAMRYPVRERHGYRAFLERVAEGVDPYRVCATRFMIRGRRGYRETNKGGASPSGRGVTVGDGEGSP